MAKKVELFSYRFACEYCGHITPWQSKTGSPDLLKGNSLQTGQKQDLEEIFSSKSSRVPLAGYQQAFSERKYYFLNANVRCPACKKVQYWSWKPNQSPKTIFDGLWLWGILSIVLLFGLAIPITIAVFLLSITEISTLMLLYGLLPVGLGFALSVAVTIEANNIYHKNLHDFETVKAKNVPEIRWNDKIIGHITPDFQDQGNGGYSFREPPPLWESLSAHENILSRNIPDMNDSSAESVPFRPSPPAQPQPQPQPQPVSPSVRTEFMRPDSAVSPRPVTPPGPFSSGPIDRNMSRQQEKKAKAIREADRVAIKENTSLGTPGNPRDISVQEKPREAIGQHLATRDIKAGENTIQDATGKYQPTRDIVIREDTFRKDTGSRNIADRGSAIGEATGRQFSAKEVSTRENAEKRGIAARGAAARENALRGANDGKTASREPVKAKGSQGITARETAARKAAQESERHSRNRPTRPKPEDPSKVASLWEASEHKELTTFTETTTKRRKKLGPHDHPSQNLQNQPSARSRETIPDRYHPSPWSSPQRGNIDEVSVKKSSRISVPDLPQGKLAPPLIDQPFPSRSVPGRSITSSPIPMTDSPMTNRPVTDRSALRKPPVSDSFVARGDNREAAIMQRHARGQSPERTKEKPIKDRSRDANHISPRTTYDVELLDIGGDSFQVMKVVREITGLPFRETQNFVESVPKILVSGVSQATADSIREKFNSLDAVIRIHSCNK